MFWTSKKSFGRPTNFFGRPKHFLDVQKLFWASKKCFGRPEKFLDVQICSFGRPKIMKTKDALQVDHCLHALDFLAKMYVDEKRHHDAYVAAEEANELKTSAERYLLIGRSP